MPEVKVKYDPAGKRKFTFVPFAVSLMGPGIVILNRHPASVPFRFVNATVKDDVSGQFTVRVPGDGRIVQIDDAFLDEDPMIYSYTVTIVLDDGQEITSPDPVIVNDPGSRDVDAAV